jgi:hypothetical protein
VDALSAFVFTMMTAYDVILSDGHPQRIVFGDTDVVDIGQ